MFKEIGEKATELTGYPAVSVYHDFRYDPKDNITGVADDWAYDHLGVHAWTTEFWSPIRAAGITDYKFIEWWSDHPIEDDLKMLAWADEVAPGEGYVNWYPYDHPDLGPVRTRRMETTNCWIRNPPPHLLADEVNAPRRLRHLAPDDLAVVAAADEVENLGDGNWRVRVVVENTGWLPTNVTAKAIERKAVRDIEAAHYRRRRCQRGRTQDRTRPTRRTRRQALDARRLRRHVGSVSRPRQGRVDRARPRRILGRRRSVVTKGRRRP